MVGSKRVCTLIVNSSTTSSSVNWFYWDMGKTIFESSAVYKLFWWLAVLPACFSTLGQKQTQNWKENSRSNHR